MYAMYIQFDEQKLFFGESNATRFEAYETVDYMLKERGFSKLGHLYIGDSSVNAVVCVLAFQDICRENPGFSDALVEAKMFRIESSADLLPAIRKNK